MSDVPVEAYKRTCQMLPKVIGEDVELRLVLGADVGQVRADGGEIEQVLPNLAVNARDASPDGGKLLIETESVHLDDRCIRKVPALKIRAVLEEPTVARAAAAGRG